jgi:two-component system, sensor histidine kinase
MIEAGDELAALKVENAKLKKIRDALISRIERGMGQPNNAFSLFEVAISLDKTVRQRTQELQTALRSVERANEALKRAKIQADQANSLKSTFLAFVSHDLLQPLNAAKLSLSGLIETETSPERAPLVRQVDNALSSLEELIRTLLDMAKLDAGVMKPNISSFPIERILGPLRREVEPITTGRRLRLKAPLCGARVLSDPLMLKRILQNLVHNAVRYTRSGGVLIGCRRRGDRLRIEVTDTGPGIPTERREEIFAEFKRGGAGGGDYGGFGLGLAIVRRLAQALDLEVELKSRVGRGSTFAITAPLDLAPPIARPAPTTLANTRFYGVDGARVLLVENDPVVAEAMSGLLNRWGCEVSLAGSGREALAAARASEGVDLIIADMHLDNGESGVDVLDAARSGLASPIPALVVTADHSETTTAAVAARGYEVLRKPIKPAELRSLMAYLLA